MASCETGLCTNWRLGLWNEIEQNLNQLVGVSVNGITWKSGVDITLYDGARLGCRVERLGFLKHALCSLVVAWHYGLEFVQDIVAVDPGSNTNLHKF